MVLENVETENCYIYMSSVNIDYQTKNSHANIIDYLAFPKEQYPNCPSHRRATHKKQQSSKFKQK